MSYLFTADTKGTFKQWKVPGVTFDETTMVLVHEFDDSHFFDIRSMTCTGNSQFTADIKGNLNQWVISESMTLFKKWENPHDIILSINATEDGQFLFTSDIYGNLKQYDIVTGELTYDYEKIHDSGIRKIITTKDSKYLFTCDHIGNIKQWLIELYSLVKDFGKAHEYEIRSIIPTSDNKFQFSIDKIGNQKEWFIKEIANDDEAAEEIEPMQSKSTLDFDDIVSYRKIDIGKMKTNIDLPKDPEVQKIRDELEYRKNLKKDFGKIHCANINSIALTPDDKYQFTADYYGVIRQWQIGDENSDTKMIKDFGSVQDCILSLVCSKDSKFLLSADDEGCVIQWDADKGTKMKKYNKLHRNEICSMFMN